MIGYDQHFIVAALENCMTRVHRLHGIALNTEKFKEITINSMRIKDTLSFMDGTLESLVETLLASDHSFNYLNQVFTCEEKQKLVLSKGVYPYEYAKDLIQMHGTTSLPPREKFYSSLKGDTVSEADYKHAQTVWKEFGCKNMIDYTRLYCVSDTVLLCEVMERFRRSIHEKYKLDPANFVSLPSLGKDLMLKISGVRLQYMDDLDMIYAIKQSIRGGLSFVGNILNALLQYV